MNHELRQVVSVIFDEVLLVAIATFLLLKALVFRRYTDFGRAISRSNLALAIAFYGSALGLHVGFFRSEAWRWGIRGAVLATSVNAVIAMVAALGGWRAAGREMRYALVELAWEVYQLPTTIGGWCCDGFTLGVAAWRRAGTRSRIAYLAIAILIVAAIVILAFVIYDTSAAEEARDYGMA